MNSFWSWQLRTGAVIAGAAMLGGCAQERDPINRVQANALSKAFFVGEDLSSPDDDPEFYTAATVVDTPYGLDSLGAFPGLTGGMRRIKWEITEDLLNARLTYESIDGVDGHGSRTTDNGRVIASFRIDKHFDIQRAYNSSTGESLNIIEENSSDRAWYDRQFMRVDWSKNLQTSSYDWDPLALYMSLDDASLQSVSYYVEDPDHPDAPHFEPDDGYFDITNKMYAEPRMLTISGQTLPACFYRAAIVAGATAPWGNCEGSEITLRLSFKKVPQEGDADFTDYQPIHWDGARMNAFGIFTVNRLGYDDNYGIIDDQWFRFASRYNIWERSHAELECNSNDEGYFGSDANRDAEPQNGTADACEAVGAGSQCDTFVKKCTLPYSQRTTRPIAWYYTIDDNDEVIYDSTKTATWQWDTAIRIAVLAARLTECRRTNGASLSGTPWQNAESCEQVFGWDQRDDAEARNVESQWRCIEGGEGNCSPNSNVTAMEPMVVLCNSPVAESDPAACGERGLVARPGDVRYHQVNVWPTPASSSPWGYGPSLTDPLTGEIISAGINVYNAVTDSAAQSYVDQLRWLNGELTSDQITSGEYVRGWSDTPAARDPGASFQLEPEEIQKRVDSLKVSAEASRRQVMDRARLQDVRNQLNFKEMSQRIEDDLHFRRLPPEVMGNDNSIFQQRINMAKGTKVEAELLNPMWSQMAGLGPDDVLEGDNLEAASPLRGMRGHLFVDGQNRVQRELARAGQCMLAAPQPTGLPGFAKIMQQKFPPLADDAAPGEQKARLVRMHDYLRGRMNHAVILHEMGHTVGLRHNFTGSYDKYNYKPQYWQLRTRGGQVTEQCDGPQTDGSDCLGPRYFDPLTDEEIDNAIWMWQHTTVMDYPGDLTQNMLSLGVYDYAAMRMFYADVVDVRDDGSMFDDGGPGEETLGLVDRAGSIVGQWVFQNNNFLHYSGWNEFFGLLWNCREAPAELTSPPAWWDEERYGIWHPVFDGFVVRNEVCDRAPVDFVKWTDMRPDSVSDFVNIDPKFFTPSRRRTFDGRPRMPYGFESDEYADGWSPSTYRHDNGADMYEEVLFHSNLYEDRHIFDNFRNNRVNFTIFGAYRRALSRYHGKIANLGQGVAFLHDFYWKTFAKENGQTTDTIVELYEGEGGPVRDHAIAASLAFDHFVRVLTRPEAGPHYQPVRDPLFDVPLIRSNEDFIFSAAGDSLVTIGQGSSTAGTGTMFGGRPLNNQFQYGQGYWSSDYVNQAGSYYEKTYALEMLMQASSRAFNFFRFDSLDARQRHTNYTNLFTEGMRQLIGLMLTQDYETFGPRLAMENGRIMTEVEAETGEEYPSRPMGWVSFVNQTGPEVCFPTNGVLACDDTVGNDITTGFPAESAALDPQLGWEVRKFIAFWTYVYMPERQEMDWVDMMRIYKLGDDTNPNYLPEQTVEFHDPISGQRYMAKRFGEETLMGRTYDRGIAAKMIQWANRIAALAFETDPTTPSDPVTGRHNYVLDAQGQPVVRSDVPGVRASDANNVQCSENPYCDQLRFYRGELDYMRETAATLGFPEPALQIFTGG